MLRERKRKEKRRRVKRRKRKRRVLNCQVTSKLKIC
jgi:hypothetical protein